MKTKKTSVSVFALCLSGIEVDFKLYIVTALRACVVYGEESGGGVKVDFLKRL